MSIADCRQIVKWLLVVSQFFGLAGSAGKGKKWGKLGNSMRLIRKELFDIPPEM